MYEDLSTFFDGFDGCFVLYHLEADSYTIHNEVQSVTRVSPASTYKVFSALIALETGVISTDSSVQEWNGTTYPYDAWNKDQNLMTAMQNISTLLSIAKALETSIFELIDDDYTICRKVFESNLIRNY